MMRVDGNGEDAVQHIRNAMQVLAFADTIVNDVRFPQRNGMVYLTADEAQAIRSRLQRALISLSDVKQQGG